MIARSIAVVCTDQARALQLTLVLHKENSLFDVYIHILGNELAYIFNSCIFA